VVFHDLVMTLLAWQLAWWTRFNFSLEEPTAELLEVCLITTPIAVLVQTGVSTLFGLYRGLWRFASLPDLFNILRATVVGVLSITLALFLYSRLYYLPRTILFLYPIYLVFLLGGPRLAYRMWKDHSLSLGRVTVGERVLVVGAGRSAEALLRQMRREGRYLPVGIVSVGTGTVPHGQIHGVAILGGVDTIPEIAARGGVDLLVIAVDTVSGSLMQRIVTSCEASGLPVRIVPSVEVLVAGDNPLNTLREIAIDDLLGREAIELDWRTIAHRIAGRVVLVTGGGGSIGAELCRQIAQIGPRTVVIVEKSEFALYEVERALRHAFPALDLIPLLGDVCDAEAMVNVFTRYRPAICFHAAAYKHVQIVERQIREGVRNNVLGTYVVAALADRFRCEKFILISTDKAVSPASVMGRTKRAAEICCEAMNQLGNTSFITVRFGNVLGSSGSVVPLFREQIAAGGPVTVTHPEVSRFFMTIPEACQLILQAAAMGTGGEIYILDMGDPIRIAFLAEQMIRFAGKEPGRDIAIEYIGLRPGEKLHETLFYDSEQMEKTSHEKILLARHVPAERERILALLAEMNDAVHRYDDDHIGRLLREILLSGQKVPGRKVIPLGEARRT
jgi:FlaA1/EpsC-like NDP-sugar epimerase